MSGDDCVSDGDAAATCKTLSSPATLCFISCRYECVWTWPGARPGGTHRTSTHTNCTRAAVLNRHEEPVLQLSSHKNAAMRHLPTGLFFVLYNITATKQTQNKFFFISPIHCSVCSEASLYSLGALDHSNLLSSSVSPMLSWGKAPKSFVLIGDGDWKNQDIHVY